VAQRAPGPRRRAVTGSVRDPLGLGENAPLLLCGIADRRPAAMARHHRCEAFAIEARHPEGHGIAVAPPNLLRGCRIALPLGDGQKSGRTRHLP
jgi:hypothetical protein